MYISKVGSNWNCFKFCCLDKKPSLNSTYFLICLRSPKQFSPKSWFFCLFENFHLSNSKQIFNLINFSSWKNSLALKRVSPVTLTEKSCNFWSQFKSQFDGCEISSFWPPVSLTVPISDQVSETGLALVPV